MAGGPSATRPPTAPARPPPPLADLRRARGPDSSVSGLPGRLTPAAVCPNALLPLMPETISAGGSPADRPSRHGPGVSSAHASAWVSTKDQEAAFLHFGCLLISIFETGSFRESSENPSLADDTPRLAASSSSHRHNDALCTPPPHPSRALERGRSGVAVTPKPGPAPAGARAQQSTPRMAATVVTRRRGWPLLARRKSSGLAFRSVATLCSGRQGCRPSASITLIR